MISSAINRAITLIQQSIPKAILEKTFVLPMINWRVHNPNTSIADGILNQIIRPIVLVDCNIIGGTEVYLPLSKLRRIYYRDYTSVYEVPKAVLGGRNIVSVLNITFQVGLTGGGVSGSAYTGNVQPGIGQYTLAIANTNSPIPKISTASVRLVSENTVMIRDNNTLYSSGYLRCLVENDENLSNINPRSWLTFSQLALLAAKAYVYNTLIINLDRGQLEAGYELGAFKDIVSSYADAQELYMTMLREKWAKIAVMNDQESYTRHIRSIVGGIR